MLKNFIFDVDRTLIDSYQPELETLKEALFIVTRTNYSNDVMEKLTTLTTDEFFKNLGIEKNSDTMKKINYYWGTLLKKRRLHFFDGVKELLIDLKGNGYFLGIVTSRDKDELNELSELLEYINLFDVVITSDMVNLPKPSPESINVIIEKFSLKREETIYIGDSQSDSVAARSALISFGFANWENKNLISQYDYLFETPQDINKLYKSRKKN
ncbi:MAG: HAD-IA family hydrolase [Bacilli bacterium]|nr:HAD-IA family hydrolase [Bacilli bacterium]